jgi:hypothetical protein
MLLTGEIPMRKTPLKKPGVPTGRRSFAGQILDIAAASARYGGTERLWYNRVAAGQVPYHRWGGRICFLAAELDAFFSNLPGVSLDEARANLQARED